ncbi:MAG TPA: hypothetical protein VFG79_12160 [Solirubrobacter sp.]|nr:hypothetical protein [Solirubrobacter sp.]
MRPFTPEALATDLRAAAGTTFAPELERYLVTAKATRGSAERVR